MPGRTLGFSARFALFSGLMLLAIVCYALFSLFGERASLYDGRRAAVRNQVETAASIIEGYRTLETQKKVSREEAQRLAAAAVRTARYGDGGYFSINDLTPRMIMHPIKPELEGQDLSGFKDPNGKALFVEIARVAREQGEGYVDYYWPKPGSAAPVPKLSFVKRIDDWNWAVISGVYLDDIQAQFLASVKASIGLIVLLLAAAAAASWWLARSVTRPIDRAVRVARAIAGGRLDEPVAEESVREARLLAAALLAMQQSLARIVERIRDASTQIEVATREIAQGNADLSGRTEGQASNLEETAASLEELTATVHQNAEHARMADAIAGQASELAARGGVTVGKLVATMAEISAASKRVEEIVAVIDGIAFQTNILALNAAVEAARAGEQGRGFAVVASEVRTLAQRSAAAAREIKGLISNSTASVETGASQANETGTEIEEIVQAVKRVTDLVAEISTASAEQAKGIAQVNEAVTSMDEMTQQNSALVEQSAAAAESLSEQAAELMAAVSEFTLASRTRPGRSPADDGAAPSAGRTAGAPRPAPRATASRDTRLPRAA